MQAWTAFSGCGAPPRVGRVGNISTMRSQTRRQFLLGTGGATLAGPVAVLLGVTLSYAYGLAAGGTVVLVGIGLYALVTVGSFVAGGR